MRLNVSRKEGQSIMRKLELHHTKRFNGALLEYYLDTEPEHTGDLWVTREQIGTFLGYAYPNNAIARIHTKHSDRLEKFSERIEIPLTKDNSTETKKVIAYSFKGLLEICRWSKKPNADVIFDCLCEFIMDI